MSGPQIHGGYICVDDNRFCRFWLIDQIRGRNIDRFGTWGNDMLLSQNKAIWKEGWVGIRDRKKMHLWKVAKRQIHQQFTIHFYWIESSIVVGVCVFLSVVTVTTGRAGRVHSIGKTHLILQALSQTLNRKISSSDSDWLFKWAIIPSNLVEHYKIWHSQKSLRKSQVTVEKHHFDDH